MKKIIIGIFLVIVIVCIVAYAYLNYVANYNNAQKENKKFEYYLNKEIYGSELTTVINKAMDSNSKNEVTKNEQGKYIENENNSINIDIKFIDNDVTYNMETIYNSGMPTFVSYYRDIKFKCQEVKYHESSNLIKYMLFEQITD